MARDKITDKSNPPKSEWFGFKYKVTPETSKLLQEAVFKDGGSWCSGETHVHLTNEACLYVDLRGSIGWSSYGHFFENHELPEKQPPQVSIPHLAPEVKSFKAGKWYKCVDKYGRSGQLVVDKYYRINELSRIESTCTLDAQCFWWDLSMFDINSESDFNPHTVDPYKHTAYVKFKGKSGYDSKEYCYKCDDSAALAWANNPALGEVFLEVDVAGEIKTVKLVGVHQNYIDTKATKCIIGTVEEAFDSMCKKLEQDIEDKQKEFIALGTADFISKLSQHIHLGNKSGNNATTNVGDVNMTTQQRKVVEVQLFDDAKGLPVQDSLVARFENVLTEDDNDTTIREVIMNNDLKATLKTHNAKRAKVINQDILERTGNSVTLQPILLKDLRWKVIG